ncbi:MAG TPA: DUF4102 domain-containing protein [Chromatiaceae bacterium]|nr:DUF4102 domain-containing protein [Chromatiaceae bacterium]
MCLIWSVYIVSTFSKNEPVRLTKTSIDNAPLPEHGQTFLRDNLLKGFGLRITANGTKSFIIEKRINGRVRRQTVARFGVLTCEQARKRAQILLGQIAEGQDPIANKKRQQAAQITLNQAFHEFKQIRKNLAPKTLKGYTKSVEAYFSGWQHRPITDITKRMVLDKHRVLGETRGEATANSAMRHLRSILNVAQNTHEDHQGRSILPVNPVSILNQNRAWFKEERRRTTIKAHELNAWYAAVQSLKSDEYVMTASVVADFLAFILFTGLRFSEAQTLKWADVDLIDRSMLIRKTKNGKPLALPLCDFHVSLLTMRRAMALNEYVFPDRDGVRHLVEPKRQLKHVRETSGVYFTVHDLRRTFATTATTLGISTYLIKRLLNHTLGNDVTEGYVGDSIEYLREPMQRVSDFLMMQCGIEKAVNVTPVNERPLAEAEA